MYLSVVIPIYNSEKYLSECIDSILNQTFMDYEIVLVDDGSTDTSKNICEDYSMKYDNVHSFSIDNSGSAYARNYGLEKASGEYVSFVDSDDWIHPKMFEKLVSLTFETKIDIVSCNLINVKANGKHFLEYSNCEGGYYNHKRIIKDIYPVLINSPDLSQHKWPMRMVTKIFNRNFLLKNNIKFENSLKAAQDFVFSVTAMYRAGTFHYLKDEYLYYYRENFESRTHKHLNKAWENYLNVNNYLESLLSDTKDYDFSNQLELSKLHGVLSSISYVYRDGNSNNFSRKYKYTKEFSSYFNLDKAMDILDWERIPSKKKIFSYLLKKKMYFLVSFLANSYYLLVYKAYKKIASKRG